MLQRLVIRNYAIIDNLTIEPDSHLNIVTGETGAGKSIILGALSLILGERADSSILINRNEKCVVEAYFDVHPHTAFQAALQVHQLDEGETQCIIRREISTQGKSRAFVNDTPVTLTVLHELTSLLVDLHQQFDHLALEDNHFQMEALDAIAVTAASYKTYESAFVQYGTISRQLSTLRDKQLQWQKEADYKKFLYDELVQAAFKENEIENAEQQLKRLEHAERILAALQVGRVVLTEGDQPLVNEVKRISQQLQNAADIMDELKPLQERLISVYAELKDIASDLESLEGKVNVDPEQMQMLQERIDLGYRLCKKHGVQTTTDLLALQSSLETELRATLDLEGQIVELQREWEEAKKLVWSEGRKLSDQRKAAAPVMSQKVTELLHLVGMPNASFKVEIDTLPEPGILGLDKISFLLDANRSGKYQPVFKAASGGEMSRLMLCIKSLTAKAMHLPTLIFDEVDTGISGEASRQVALLLRNLAQHHQVICITHQPQVAAKGSTHLFVYKEADMENRIKTRVRVLQSEERVMAIAQMIGGESPSEAAVQNARELVA